MWLLCVWLLGVWLLCVWLLGVWLLCVVAICRRMKGPSMTAVVQGKNRSLYIASIPSLEEATKANLKKTLRGLPIALHAC